MPCSRKLLCSMLVVRALDHKNHIRVSLHEGGEFASLLVAQEDAAGEYIPLSKAIELAATLSIRANEPYKPSYLYAHIMDICQAQEYDRLGTIYAQAKPGICYFTPRESRDPSPASFPCYVITMPKTALDRLLNEEDNIRQMEQRISESL